MMYLQLSQVGKVVKSFAVDGGQLVVAKISGKERDKRVNILKFKSDSVWIVIGQTKIVIQQPDTISYLQKLSRSPEKQHI